MLIEIVSHCWAKELPHYASALAYQLSSLVLHKPTKCNVLATICCAKEDFRTEDVWRYFAYEWHLPIRIIHLTPGQLGRRAIGRNVAALKAEGDIVWFSDVDQCFRDGILDRLAFMEWPSGFVLKKGPMGIPAPLELDASMIYPKEIMIHRDHATGDEDLALISTKPRLLDVDPDRFVTKKYGRAIGGVQIVEGNFARAYGYLQSKPKWQRETSGIFDRCSCDRPYRSFCSDRGSIVGVDLPGLYRLRHSESGHGRTPSTGGAGFKEGK